MRTINFQEDIARECERIEDPNDILGKGSIMPHNGSCSGARKLMHSVQVEHIYPLINPEVPYESTGRENEFAKYSSAFIEADDDYEVVAKIDKFSFIKNGNYINYIAICRRKSDGVYHVFNRTSYEYITESYGYLYNNNRLDRASVGSTIKKGERVITSNSIDEYGNRKDGLNMMVCYMSKEKNKEDAIIISKSAQKRLVSPEISYITVVINDNDIMLNLFGDDNFYCSLPNVGEKVNGNIICALRKERKDQALYSLASSRLRHITMSDEKIIVSGDDLEIIDLNIYCNNPEILKKNYYNAQLDFYYQEKLNYNQKILDILQPLKDSGAVFTPELKHVYLSAKNIMSGKETDNDKDKTFSNTIIEIAVLNKNMIKEGDKIANRYGGKGCISVVLPDDEMPLLDNGQHADVILNPSGVPNRENIGQCNELEINMRAQELLEYIRNNNIHPTDATQMIITFLTYVSPKMASKYQETLMSIYEEEMNSVNYSSYNNAKLELMSEEFFSSLLNDDCIYHCVEPLTESLKLTTLEKLDKRFPFFRQRKCKVCMKDSNGNKRYVQSRKVLSVGYQYMYRLKQYAKEKSSVTSLASTNLRNLPTKNSNKKAYKILHSSTPIGWNAMETADLGHIGFEHVIVNLMLNSTSPIGRRSAISLLTGNPYDIDVKLPADATNRKVEILNAYLTAIGLEFKFIKKWHKPKAMMLIRPITFETPRLEKKIVFDVPSIPNMQVYLDSLEDARKVRMLIKGIDFDAE